MRVAGVVAAAFVLVSAAAARVTSTFTVTASGSAGGATVQASGADSQTALDGIVVTAALPGGKTVSATSYGWSWKSSSNMHHGTSTQTLTLSVQISSTTGLTDCTVGTNGTVTLVDSNVKLKNGKSSDAIRLAGWSGPCAELTTTFSNSGKGKASVTIAKSP